MTPAAFRLPIGICIHFLYFKFVSIKNNMNELIFTMLDLYAVSVMSSSLVCIYLHLLFPSLFQESVDLGFELVF